MATWQIFRTGNGSLKSRTAIFMRLSLFTTGLYCAASVCFTKERALNLVTWESPTLHDGYAPLLLMDESFRLSNHSPPYCGQDCDVEAVPHTAIMAALAIAI